MCDEYNQRPIGTAEVEQVWYEYQRKARDSASNDIYTNGGLLDSSNSMGYQVIPPYGAPMISREILENEFSYGELKFISNARLLTMTVPDVEKLIMLLTRFKQSLEVKGLTSGQGTIGYPNNFVPAYNSNVQPLYGCPIPADQRNLNAKWEKDLWTRKWGNLGEESGFDFPKDKEEDDKKEEEKMPSFLGAAWNDPAPVRTKTEKVYSPGTLFPEKIGEKKGSHKSTVVLSAEGVSSNDDNRLFKVVSDEPSTGIAINENPVPLTTDEKDSVDKDNEKD